MIYNTLYDLVNSYIFVGNVLVGSYQELVCIIVSVIGCLFVFSIPFILVYRIIKLLVGD